MARRRGAARAVLSPAAPVGRGPMQIRLHAGLFKGLGAKTCNLDGFSSGFASIGLGRSGGAVSSARDAPPHPGARSCRSDESESIPFPGADSIFSRPCGAPFARRSPLPLHHLDHRRSRGRLRRRPTVELRDRARALHRPLPAVRSSDACGGRPDRRPFHIREGRAQDRWRRRLGGRLEKGILRLGIQKEEARS